jgi:hypothetical protein
MIKLLQRLLKQKYSKILNLELGSNIRQHDTYSMQWKSETPILDRCQNMQIKPCELEYYSEKQNKSSFLRKEKSSMRDLRLMERLMMSMISLLNLKLSLFLITLLTIHSLGQDIEEHLKTFTITILFLIRLMELKPEYHENETFWICTMLSMDDE